MVHRVVNNVNIVNIVNNVFPHSYKMARSYQNSFHVYKRFLTFHEVVSWTEICLPEST